jgi:hypothetical protein
MLFQLPLPVTVLVFLICVTVNNSQNNCVGVCVIPKTSFLYTPFLSQGGP